MKIKLKMKQCKNCNSDFIGDTLSGLCSNCKRTGCKNLKVNLKKCIGCDFHIRDGISSGYCKKTNKN